MKTKKEWRVSSGTLGGIPCIEHVDNMNMRFPKLPVEREKALRGDCGEIWEQSATLFSAVIYYKDHDQIVRNIELSELPQWCKKLGVPRSPSLQAQIANSNYLKSDT